MNPTYRLSNRQQKELLVRGKILKIAIPYDEIDDCLDFAIDSLPEHADYVMEAEIIEMRVWPSGETNGLIGLLGEIPKDNQPNKSSAITCKMLVVIATLEPARKPTGTMRIQWPAKVFFADGSQYPND